MSVDAIEAVLTRSKARGADRLVLLAVAWHLNHEHPERPAWPSIGRIAEMANVSVRQVKASLRRLEQSGELEVQRRHGPRGTNFYGLGGALTQTEESAPSQSVALGEDTSPKDAGQKPNATDGAQNAQNDVLPKPALGENCAQGVKTVHVALGEVCSPKPVEPEINTTGGMAQKTNGAFSVPGAGATASPTAPPALEKYPEACLLAETKGQPLTEATAWRRLLEVAGIQERDYRRAGKIVAIARDWAGGILTESEAVLAAVQIANGGQ